jgi:trk system potassium uptake protein TrkH
MNISMKNIVRLIGVIIFVTGLAIVPSLITALIYHEIKSAVCFGATMAICILPGLIIMKILPADSFKMHQRDSYLYVTLTWFIVSLVAAVPLTASGAIPHYYDSFFEMCSGFSTTGSTILSNVEALPKSMLFWRSFTHWLGGMGIIVFTAAIMPNLGISGQSIAEAEAPGPTMDKLTAKYTDTAKNLYLLYIGITIAETILLMLGGMSLYDALVQTFGTVGTGGFSNYSNSIAHFTSPYIQWIIIIFMLMCGTNFNLYFGIPKYGPKALLKDSEFRLYMAIVLATTAGITIDLIACGMIKSPFKSLTAAAFQVSSLITTTGYATKNYDMWPTFSKMLLMITFLTGACASSTGGGPKIIRILVALKMIRRSIALKIHPSRVYTIKVNGKPVEREVLTNISNFIFFYIVVLFIGCIIVGMNGYDVMTTFSSVLTCLGNVGPGFNKVGPIYNFGFFAPWAKIVLSVLMIAGRLELFTVLTLLSPRYWNSNKN